MIKTYTDEELAKEFSYLDDRLRKLEKEKASPTISDAVINSIEAFKNNNVNEIREWEWAKKGHFKSKRHWVEYMLASPNRTIFRVSNGKESFTVDEDACYEILGKPSQPFKITSFEISDYCIKVFAGTKCYMCDSESLRKVSKPILITTTEDGKEIFDGEQIVYGAYAIKHGTEHTTYDKKAHEIVGAKDWKWFSTPEAREDYIQLHSKTLSISDVEKAVDTINMGGWSANIKSELVNALKSHK